jgi:hypothetical protein
VVTLLTPNVPESSVEAIPEDQARVNASEGDDWRAAFAKSERPVRRGGVGDRTISATTPALYSTSPRNNKSRMAFTVVETQIPFRTIYFIQLPSCLRPLQALTVAFPSRSTIILQTRILSVDNLLVRLATSLRNLNPMARKDHFAQKKGNKKNV